MGLEEKLQKILEREREKTSEDVQWALEKDPETANKVLKFLRSSMPLKIAVFLGAIAGIYVTVTTLSTNQLLALLYFLTGIGVAKVSDYGWSDWESYFAIVFWLPVVVYSFLPDRVRIEK
jgi:hypothetical protein